MTNEEINIAIAETFGWEQCHWNGAYDETKGIPPIRPSKFEVIPDYCNDLNAIHEAETHLDSDVDWQLWEDYVFNLNEVIGRNHREDRLVHATARQRAESFLRTVGKWRE